MAYIPGFTNDIFISYSHADNWDGWVEGFETHLTRRLLQLGTAVRIWRDTKLQGTDVFSAETFSQLEQSALLISIVSPAAIGSRWCEDERQAFERFADLNGGFRFDNQLRAIKVVKTPLADGTHRDLFGVLGYEFFKREGQSHHFHEFDQSSVEFRQLRDRLALDILRLLEAFRQHLDLENKTEERLPSPPASEPTKESAGKHTHELPEQTRDEHYTPQRGVLSDLIKGLVLIAFVMTIKLAVEQTRLGQQLNQLSYNSLHLPLSAERMPVTIVDISDLQPEQFTIDGQFGTATPRDKLQRMIASIAAHEPKAIGVNIDFSPENGLYIHPNDPKFFQFCLDMRQKGVPVFLGINRTITRSPPEWLGSEKYKDLAANLYIPLDSTRMLEAVTVDSGQESRASTGSNNSSRAMSAALAATYSTEPDDSGRKSMSNTLHRLGLVERISEKNLGPGLTVRDFPVDFSQIDSIETIRTTNPVVLADQSQSKLFQGKVVLIGDASPEAASSLYTVPQRSHTYPAIFLHASAVYTLIRASRFDVTKKGRLGFDVLFTAAILAAIILVRRHFRNQYPARVTLQGFFLIAIVAASMIVAVVFARSTRIIWDDFLVAPVLLSFHPKIERGLQFLWRKIKELDIFKKGQGVVTMKLMIGVLTACVCAAVVLGCPRQTVAQQTPAAIVEEIDGATFWRKSAGARRIKRLDRKRDAARPLFAGEQVLRRRGSVLRLRFSWRESMQVPEEGWFTIKQPASAQSDPFKIMLRYYAGPSERERTGGTQVFSPSDHSKAVPNPFVIQWTPSAVGCVFSMTIQDVVRRKIWENNQVDGSLGSLQDSAAERFLTEYRARGMTGTLTLIVNNSCGSTDQLSFSLLTLNEERSLKTDLDIWNEQTGTSIPHLGRASVYERYRMLAEAAREYEAALTQEPHSHFLLRRTIVAQRAIGNFDRTSELKKRLPAGAIVP